MLPALLGALLKGMSLEPVPPPITGATLCACHWQTLSLCLPSCEKNVRCILRNLIERWVADAGRLSAKTLRLPDPSVTSTQGREAAAFTLVKDYGHRPLAHDPASCTL